MWHYATSKPLFSVFSGPPLMALPLVRQYVQQYVVHYILPQIFQGQPVLARFNIFCALAVSITMAHHSHLIVSRTMAQGAGHYQHYIKRWSQEQKMIA